MVDLKGLKSRNALMPVLAAILNIPECINQVWILMERVALGSSILRGNRNSRSHT